MRWQAGAPGLVALARYDAANLRPTSSRDSPLPALALPVGVAFAELAHRRGEDCAAARSSSCLIDGRDFNGLRTIETGTHR